MNGRTGASHGPLEESAAPELVESAHRLELEGAEELWEGFTLADAAHVLMLEDQSLIPSRAAAALLEGLLALHDESPEDHPLDPYAGDIYRNRENRLDDMSDVQAGWMGVGRPRREAHTHAYQLTARRLILRCIDAAVDLEEALLSISRSHRETLMPDYTYIQRAQPTTLGHYLMGFFFPLQRDLRRFKRIFEQLDRCPAGTGSTNGSRLDLDRSQLADLLGFSGLVSHARDAMWQPDLPVEIHSALLTASNNLARMASDLQVFCTREFGFLRLADRHSRSSVIMPQKKNPYALAYIRGVAGELSGRVSSMAGVGKTPTGQVDNRLFPYHVVPRSIPLVTRTLRLAAEVLRGLDVDRKKMEEAAGDPGLAATDLAEHLVISRGIDYRRAHRIVAAVVQRWEENPPEQQEFTPDDLNQVAKDRFGLSLDITGEELEEVLDPKQIVHSRQTPGGAAKQPMQRMFDRARTHIEENRSWHQKRSSRVHEAKENLLQRARERINEGD